MKKTENDARERSYGQEQQRNVVTYDMHGAQLSFDMHQAYAPNR